MEMRIEDDESAGLHELDEIAIDSSVDESLARRQVHPVHLLYFPPDYTLRAHLQISILKDLLDRALELSICRNSAGRCDEVWRSELTAGVHFGEVRGGWSGLPMTSTGERVGRVCMGEAV